MTWGFVASFGGLLFVMAAMLIVEKLISHRVAPLERVDSRESELAATLRRAEAAARETEEEIARARAIASI